MVLPPLAVAAPARSAPSTAAPGTQAGDGGARLADVRVAEDPRALAGPRTATVDESAVDPVAVSPSPALPVTVTDMQGSEVTVTDASRILALDMHGTLARIVFELGLGDNVVGRDTSSTFAEIADRPLVTSNGHELAAEAILDLAPTVILTDTSRGPCDVE